MAYAPQQIGFLKKVHRCGKSQKPHLISGCNREQVYAISECSDNILRGGVALTTRQKKRLQKHYGTLKNLADPSIHWKKKKKHLATQEGGILLSSVLSAAVPFLINYLASK
jgi:hypothetical protein